MYLFFQESDWGVHAKRGGAICTASGLACGVIGFALIRWIGAIVSLGVALFLALFEVPWVYKCFEVR